MDALGIVSAVLVSRSTPSLYRLRFPPGEALPQLENVYSYRGRHFRMIGLLEMERRVGPLALGELVELPAELDEAK